MAHSPLHDQFGDIDIYLFDQLLRGRVSPGMRIFDGGCGDGRNLTYFIKQGYAVAGCDPDAHSVARLSPFGDFRPEALETHSFSDAWADVAIVSAVLHFAKTDAQFDGMLKGAWRVLMPGGLFFARLASSIGIETQVRKVDGRWHALPDGSERYLVDEALLLSKTRELGSVLLDPLKTTVVQNQRSMTTWVLRK
jgi:tellurite methyltransferase